MTDKQIEIVGEVNKEESRTIECNCLVTSPRPVVMKRSLDPRYRVGKCFKCGKEYISNLGG